MIKVTRGFKNRVTVRIRHTSSFILFLSPPFTVEHMNIFIYLAADHSCLACDIIF